MAGTELRQVTLQGGPLDGRAFLVSADSDGAYLSVPGSPGGLYEPVPGGDPDAWFYGGANA
ncbi:hypothetical protein [Planomonospora sp. ID82291]|uniref:hypothetical protein n=1 Tax=Planomonospora sp. ID82291 TaxID=2738136 RepID=UPI0018C37808|nr:hypothetical protein [Planomonospora sp. ID82291]MBG0819080.1 hypothetical protein [Planomonospora sp. ID82291]